MDERSFWFQLLGEYQSETDISNYIGQAEILLNSNYYFLKRKYVGSPDHFSIYEAYRQAVYLEPLSRLTGFWMRSEDPELSGLTFTEVHFWDRRQNLSGVLFSTVTLAVSLSGAISHSIPYMFV